MDYNVMIQAVMAHTSVISVVLLVLIMAEEFVANSSLFKSNSVGQLVLNSVKLVLVSIFNSKTTDDTTPPPPTPPAAV